MHPLLAVTAACVHCLTSDVQTVHNHAEKTLAPRSVGERERGTDQNASPSERRGRLAMSPSERGVRWVTKPHAAVRR